MSRSPDERSDIRGTSAPPPDIAHPGYDHYRNDVKPARVRRTREHRRNRLNSFSATPCMRSSHARLARGMLALAAYLNLIPAIAKELHVSHPAMSPDNVAVITGGASGIGLAAAMRFARAGM